VESKETGTIRTTVTTRMRLSRGRASAGTTRLGERKGFAKQIIPDLTLTLDRTATVDIAMKVAETPSKSKSRPTPPDHTTTPAEGLTISPEQVHDIPLNGRDYIDLLQMVPA